jgi:hypothetical protein
MYCQREIEGNSSCESQCLHCAEYYAPCEENALTVEDLIKDAAIKYADTHKPNTPENMEDEVQWYNDVTAFEKGAQWYKNNFDNKLTDDESESGEIFKKLN